MEGELTMIISATQKPSVGIWGGSVWDWERGTDPFNDSVTGWIALDGWGNQIGFCADGVEYDLR